MKTHFAEKTIGYKCYMPKCSDLKHPRFPIPQVRNVPFKRFFLSKRLIRRRRVQNISPTRPRSLPTRQRNLADASKIFRRFRRRVQRFHRRRGKAADATSHRSSHSRCTTSWKCNSAPSGHASRESVGSYHLGVVYILRESADFDCLHYFTLGHTIQRHHELDDLCSATVYSCICRICTRWTCHAPWDADEIQDSTAQWRRDAQ